MSTLGAILTPLAPTITVIVTHYLGTRQRSQQHAELVQKLDQANAPPSDQANA